MYTKPNTSLKVAARLADLGVMVYAPTQTVVRQWADRKKKVQVQVMPSMVLVNVHEKDTGMVFQVPGVVRYLFEQGKRAKVQDKDVVAMQLHLEGKAIAAQTAVQVGDTVQVPQLDEKATVVALREKKMFGTFRAFRRSGVISIAVVSN